MKESGSGAPLRPIIARMSDIPPVACPCGKARRGLYREDNDLCTLHQVDIKVNAAAHYHKSHTEIYYILKGEGFVELDNERVPAEPGAMMLIPPGVRHRALIEEGQEMTILNFVVPPFDPADEWED